MIRRLQSLFVPLTPVLLLLASCGGDGGGGGADQPSLAFVTNGTDPFWTIAAAGVAAAAEDHDLDCDVRMPADAVDQKRIVEDLLTRGVDGIAISPIDAANQTDMLNEACGVTRLITHDSDAPDSDRLCYVGMDNYTAGRLCGDLVREAMPGGGSVMIFVGRLEQDNAQKRRQGVIDAILGRDADPGRFDTPGSELEGGGYTILDTRTDQFDRARAKSNAEDTLSLHPDIGCMVGLFAYNVPACLSALEDAGKLGDVVVASFDEDDATLQGILDGHVCGTVVQQPYEYGYQSMKLLGELERKGDGALPGGGYVDVPAKVIRRDDAEAFRQEKARLLGQ